ncbi:MAG: hypothetical protein ABIQ12_06600 [Opitutaceae bacterium]
MGHVPTLNMKAADFKNLLQGVREAGSFLRGNKRAAARVDSIVAKKMTTWSAYARARRANLKTLFPDGPILTAAQSRKLDRFLADDPHAHPDQSRD